MRSLLILPLALLASCVPKPITQVKVSGTVFDGPDSIDPVAGSTVEVRSFDGALFDSTTADTSGRFTVNAPASEPAFMVVNGDLHVPTSFTVNIGTADVTVPAHAIWARRASVLDTHHADFTGCDDAESASRSIEGEVRLYLGTIDEPGSEPLVNTALVYFEGDDGSLINGCYLDDVGTSDPDATLTGETGRYAIIDPPVGPGVFTVAYDANGTQLYNELLLYVPEGGTVPIYPTYVPIQ